MDVPLMNGRPRLRKVVMAMAPSGYRERVEASVRGAEFDGVEVVFAGEREAILREVADADVLCAANVDEELVRTGKGLRWIQLQRGGLIEPLPRVLVESEVVVTCFKELFAAPGAEFALMALLMISRRMTSTVGCAPLPQTIVSQDQVLGPVDLAGATLGIVGLGNIGRRTAELCRALSMRVLGCARTERAAGAVDEFFALADLERMVGVVDYLLLAVPVTPGTEGIMSERVLAAMRPGAWLVDVSARPQLIDYGALERAIDEGRLGGVVLQPVGARFPGMPDEGADFWRRGNVVVSSCRCVSSEQVEQTIALFPDNMRRWREGRPLRGLMDKAEGY